MDDSDLRGKGKGKHNKARRENVSKEGSNVACLLIITILLYCKFSTPTLLYMQ